MDDIAGLENKVQQNSLDIREIKTSLKYVVEGLEALRDSITQESQTRKDEHKKFALEKDVFTLRNMLFGGAGTVITLVITAVVLNTING